MGTEVTTETLMSQFRITFRELAYLCFDTLSGRLICSDLVFFLCLKFCCQSGKVMKFQNLRSVATLFTIAFIL